MPRFIVWGRIAGEPVPDMSVGPLRTTSTVPTEFVSLASQGGVEDLRASFQGAVSSATAHRVDIAAESDHYFWIDRDASDAISAGKIAIREYLTPFVAALVVTAGEAYYAQAIWASELDPRGRIVRSTGVPIERTTGIHFERRPDMPSEPVADAVSAMESDAPARQAAGYLVEGLRMKFRATSDAELGSAILQLHLGTETLARTVFGTHDEEELLARQQEIVARLRETLGRAGTTSQAAKAIKNASIALDREQLRFLADQIRRLGSDLGVDSETVKDAVKVATFRNQALGHSSTRGVGSEGWGTWANRAFRTSSTFLRAYCERAANNARP
ncbi:hypothetical protein [Aeromicrobium sp.]|uniref:hypothetical protein n=1 Tax=Aeromicrobium sp. TaxID=1871063 RepID=UPI0030BF8AFA